MSQYVKTIFLCAECGEQRKEANHWYIVLAPDKFDPQRTQEQVKFLGGAFFYLVTELGIARTTLRDDEFPVCGESCLNKLTSKILSEKKPCAV